jgi:flotillin
MITLFAQLNSSIQWMGLLVLTVVLVFATFVVLLAKRYRRCPSNRVLVIYGKAGGGRAVKCLHGGATFVWPLIQDHAYLNLEPIQIEIPLRGALSAENIRVNVPSVFTVAVGTVPEVMQNAAVRLLGLNVTQVEKQAQEIIFGQLRQVIASMRIEDINRDRDISVARTKFLGAGTQENRSRADQRQYYGHHGRGRLHRCHRPKSRLASESTGAR